VTPPSGGPILDCMSTVAPSSSGWVALVAYRDEAGVLHVGPLPAARRPGLAKLG
jgi:hypothetical protein